MKVKVYALEKQVHEQIIAFLSFRSILLHKLDPQQPAWCSPRSWVMASHLHYAGLDIASAVGEGAAAEFAAYITLYETLPDLVSILEGNGSAIAFSEEPSVRYATTIGLAVRAKTAEQAYTAISWLNDKATAEWVQVLTVDIFGRMRQLGQMGALSKLVKQDSELQQFLQNFRELVGY